MKYLNQFPQVRGNYFSELFNDLNLQKARIYETGEALVKHCNKNREELSRNWKGMGYNELAAMQMKEQYDTISDNIDWAIEEDHGSDAVFEQIQTLYNMEATYRICRLEA